MKQKELITQLYKLLIAAYGPQGWWPAESPYEMMIGAILTQNTAWTNVEKAIENLRPHLNPSDIETIEQETLGGLIRPSGYFNQKAKKIKALTDWFKQYQWDVECAMKTSGEQLRKELLSIWGIGGETADSILTYALGKPYFVIDAYTRRILSRMGCPVPKNYDAFRELMEAQIPKDLQLYNEYHALLVRLAKDHCRSKPTCNGCPASAICQKQI